MLIKIDRFKEIIDGTLGELTIYSDKGTKLFQCYTLEPEGDDCVECGLDKRIPAGEYKLNWHNSAKFKTKLPRLYNDLVSPSRYILIHAGNYANDTEGCVLVGSSWDNKGVYGSKAALAKVLRFIEDITKVKVEISNERLLR